MRIDSLRFIEIAKINETKEFADNKMKNVIYVNPKLKFSLEKTYLSYMYRTIFTIQIIMQFKNKGDLKKTMPGSLALFREGFR